MPTTPRMGHRFLTILGVTTLLGVGVQVANFAQHKAARFPELPEQIEGYERRGAEPVPANVQRDSPEALNYGYYKGDLPALRVSIARADSLNAYRAATRYLLDTDGRILQEGTLTRYKDRIPTYNFLVGAGRGEIIIAAQWTQTPGEDPVLEPLDAPGKIVESLFTKQPVFICVVWVTDRADLKGLRADELIGKFSTQIDAKIKAMK